MKRGVFPLGRTVIASGDLFGLFPVNRNFKAQDSLLVYPMMFDIQAFPSPIGWLSGSPPDILSGVASPEPAQLWTPA